MIDLAHHDSAKINELADFAKFAENSDIMTWCKQGFAGDQPIEFYNGLFSAYVNSCSLIQQAEKTAKEEYPLLMNAFATVVSFVAIRLQEMQAREACTKAQKFTPEQALEEYEKMWEPTTGEKNHLRELFEKLAGRNPTRLIEGASCPRCEDSEIGKDHYCRDCGYGL